MAVKTFLCPVVMSTRQTPGGRIHAGWRPSVHPLSLALPGRTAGAAVIGRVPGRRQPICLYTVWADDFTDLDAHPDVVDFGGVPQSKLSEYLQHLESFPFNAYARRLEIIGKADEIGLTRSLTGRSVGAVLREFLTHLEPAATDDLYEKTLPGVKETITDDFNRSTLGSGWAASLGTIWVTNGDITARPVDNYMVTTVKRSEASFPDDQYAQCDTEHTNAGGGEVSQGGAMIRCSNSSSFYSAKVGINFTELNKNSTADYIADASITLAIDTMVAVKLTGAGTTITVHIGGTQRISVTDSSHASGVPGMWSATAAPESFEDHDNFECTDAVAGAGNDARIVFRGA